MTKLGQKPHNRACIPLARGPQVPLIYCSLYVLPISTPGSLGSSQPQGCNQLCCMSLCLLLVACCLSLVACACCLCLLLVLVACAHSFLEFCPGASPTLIAHCTIPLFSLLQEFASRRNSKLQGFPNTLAFQLLFYFTFLQTHSLVLQGVHSVRPWGKSSTWTLLHFFAPHLHCYNSLHCYTSLHLHLHC